MCVWFLIKTFNVECGHPILRGHIPLAVWISDGSYKSFQFPQGRRILVPVLEIPLLINPDLRKEFSGRLALRDYRIVRSDIVLLAGCDQKGKNKKKEKMTMIHVFVKFDFQRSTIRSCKNNF